MRNKLLTLLLLLSIPFLAQAESRDPFSPYAWEKKIADEAAAKSQPNYDVTPLTEFPLASYVLAGVIVSPKDAIALIRTRTRREFYVHLGDSLGKEGGVVDIISVEGITVNMNGKIVDVSVNNRFEAGNEIVE